MYELNNRKKIIYIAGAVVILMIAGFILYRSLLPEAVERLPANNGEISGGSGKNNLGAGEDGELVAEEEKTGETVTAKLEEQKLVRLADFPVVSVALNKEQTKIQFYKKDGGDLFASDFKAVGREKVSNITIVGLFEALWQKDGSRAAVFYLDGETVKGFLHTGSTSVAALPQDITSFSWSPDGKSLAYTIPNSTTLNLSTAENSGRNARIIFSTPILDARVFWITGDKIAFETSPSGRAEGYLFSYSRPSGSFLRIIGPLFGLSSIWSPNGSRILVSSTSANGQNPLLEVYDATGHTLFDVSARTIAQKCAWASEDTAYCGVPATTSGVTWPDDYLRGEVNTRDKLVSLDFKKKEIIEILNEGNFDISDIIISKNQDYLFFINRTDGTPWSLKLK